MNGMQVVKNKKDVDINNNEQIMLEERLAKLQRCWYFVNKVCLMGIFSCQCLFY